MKKLSCEDCLRKTSHNQLSPLDYVERTRRYLAIRNLEFGDFIQEPEIILKGMFIPGRIKSQNMKAYVCTECQRTKLI